MIVQEPVQAAVWYSLNHYSFSDALFLAERLHSEIGNDETLHLLATCYYRAGKREATYSILSKRALKSPRCRLLLARCCVDLKKYSEAEEALLRSFVQYKAKNPNKCLISSEELINEFGESAAFVAQLLGIISAKTERRDKAAEYYRVSLKLNPFLWSSYDSLVNMGAKPDASKTFDVSNINFNLCHGSNPLISLWNASKVPENFGFSSQSTQASSVKDLSNVSGKFDINSPFAVIRSASESNCIDVVTPDNNWNAVPAPVPKVPTKLFRKSCLGTVTENSPLSPIRSETPTGSARLSFGVFQLSDVSGNLPASTPTANQESHPIENANKIAQAPAKRQTRRTQQPQPPSQYARRSKAKVQIFSQSGNINSESNSLQSAAALAPTGVSSLPLRRSSRLFNSSSSVKENTKNSARNQENNKGSVINKTPTKKTRKNATSTISNTSLQKESELNELNKQEVKGLSSNEDIMHTGLKLQKASAEGLMNLFVQLGKALSFQGQFHSLNAIDVLRTLPQKHFNSGWVQSALGRAYFELAKYEDAVKHFENAHDIEPHRLQGMEIYSTALWHLQNEVKLSILAQELVDFDKNAPETWCVAGNCFSLQKEHETAIKFLQRAIQVDPDFAYAYTLLGHELVSTEEMDHAMASFRNAIRIDPRHYNAWYGIGMINFKQEKYSLAETHYKKALEISPFSPVLTCHLGVVQHSQKKTDVALKTLDKAIEMDPKNALCKFQRASFYLSLDKHDEALRELEELKKLVPKESLVYFLIGKVHKRRGNTHEALLNFSWAMDLDPKGANNQIKEVIDRQNANDDEEVVVCLDSNEDPSASNISSSVSHVAHRRGQVHAESMDADDHDDDDFEDDADDTDQGGNAELSI
ncbi:Cell division cycle protein 27 -like protein [Halotydeus destructor]|nr:Cell division cycle protein 27 -like protein [Halotydeus destructor]